MNLKLDPFRHETRLALALAAAFGLSLPTLTAASLTPLGDLPGGFYISVAGGVSGDGSTVVGYSTTANGSEAFRWNGGTMTGLGDLPGGGFGSYARGVSGDGSTVVGNSISANGYEAFVWTQADGMKSLVSLLLASGINPASEGWSRLSDATGPPTGARWSAPAPATATPKPSSRT